MFALLLWACTGVLAQQSEVDGLLLKWDEEGRGKSFAENKEELNKILAIARQANDYKGQSSCYRRLGTLFYRNGSYDSAIGMYVKASENSEAAHDTLGMGSTSNQIGNVYYYLKDYRNALFYFKKAIGIYTTKKAGRYGEYGIITSAANAAEVYLLLDSLPQAEEFTLRSTEAMRRFGDTSEIGSTYYNLGILYEKQGRPELALAFLKKSVDRFAIFPSVQGVVPSLNAMGRLFSARRQHDSALYYHQLAYDSAAAYQDIPLLAETLQALSKASEEAGDVNAALRYIRLERTLSDSLLDKTRVAALIDAERKYQGESKSRQIEQQQIVINKKNFWIVSLTVSIIVLSAISILIVIIYRNKKRIAQKDAELHRGRVDELLREQEVVSVNGVLKGQDAERKRIAQELHDRLGSMLSTVKLHFSNVEESINALKIQQAKSYQQANELLDEACEEVRRISHDLYEGSLAKFGFRTALLQLISAIEGGNTVRIKFMDNAIDPKLYKGFETELYRVTQELLSNTLKYANAKQITIQLNTHDKTFIYSYEDNGRGFDPAILQSASGIGYKNIDSRVQKMNGTWHADSTPGHGMTLIIEVPLNGTTDKTADSR